MYIDSIIGSQSMTKQIMQRAVAKATQSICQHKVSAVGLDRYGRYIASAVNKKRFHHRGGGIHAEIELIRKAGHRLKTIVLCRVNESGDCLPVHPCDACRRVIDKRGLKVVTLER